MTGDKCQVGAVRCGPPGCRDPSPLHPPTATQRERRLRIHGSLSGLAVDFLLRVRAEYVRLVADGDGWAFPT